MGQFNFRRKYARAETNHKNWRELCSAALNAGDPDELLEIVQELNKALKREEEVRRDLRAAQQPTKAPEEADVNRERCSG